MIYRPIGLVSNRQGDNRSQQTHFGGKPSGCQFDFFPVSLWFPERGSAPRSHVQTPRCNRFMLNAFWLRSGCGSQSRAPNIEADFENMLQDFLCAFLSGGCYKLKTHDDRTGLPKNASSVRSDIVHNMPHLTELASVWFSMTTKISRPRRWTNVGSQIGSGGILACRRAGLPAAEKTAHKTKRVEIFTRYETVHGFRAAGMPPRQARMPDATPPLPVSRRLASSIHPAPGNGARQTGLHAEIVRGIVDAHQQQ